MDNDFKCDPELGRKCKNNTLCYLCDGQRLLKLPKPRTYKKSGTKKKKEGMQFEKDVARNWNQSGLKKTARRQPNSGAIINMPGDITTPDDIMECKERGTITTKGAKTFTIALDWISKIKREAISAGKYQWYIPFRFKDNNEIFIIKSFDSELEMLQIIQSQQETIKKLQEEGTENGIL